MVNISFLIDNVEEIAAIDDVFIPPIIHRLVKMHAFPFYNELYANQEKFIVEYRYGEYSIDGETPKDEEDRLFKDLFMKYPHLISLIDDSKDTFEEDMSTFAF